MNILKIALNSQTIRIVTDTGCVDYHVDNGMSSSLVMRFLKGKGICLDGYESKKVGITDDFTWKSKTDGDNKQIHYTDGTNKPYAPTAQPVRQVYSYQQQSTRYVPHPTPKPKPKPQPNKIDINKTNFGKLFGGNS